MLSLGLVLDVGGGRGNVLCCGDMSLDGRVVDGWMDAR